MSNPPSLTQPHSVYKPRLLSKFKRKHLQSECSNRLFGVVNELVQHGLIERKEMKLLVEHAEKTLDRIQGADFALVRPVQIGHQGKRMKDNPNLFPFVELQQETGGREFDLARIPNEESLSQSEEEQHREFELLLRQMLQHTKQAGEFLGRRRRHSFSHFHPQRHQLECPLLFDVSQMERLVKEAEAEKISPTQVLELRQALQLDDGELRRF